ncbi:hypothetical protein CLOSYM_05014 [[Clostridium] symbiosum ATCC 14940]|uniref:Uncharacterized protein n=1 Tax=[Clostridium] symbiosum ATCC 14940 TaxID=411472 RepID=A0ABC9TPC3_CLOSY|nr:hypothetical protein CLOSYM_05014 [[Clostridium] symbiosum ATCC 14940]
MLRAQVTTIKKRQEESRSFFLLSVIYTIELIIYAKNLDQ